MSRTDIFNPTPRTAVEANRLVARFASALQIIADGYKFVAMSDITGIKTEQELIAVYKPTDEAGKPSYWIYAGTWVTQPTGCTCPDFCKGRDFCKHTLAYMEIKNQIAAAEAYFAMMDNAECATGCDPYSRY